MAALFWPPPTDLGALEASWTLSPLLPQASLLPAPSASVIASGTLQLLGSRGQQRPGKLEPAWLNSTYGQVSGHQISLNQILESVTRNQHEEEEEEQGTRGQVRPARAAASASARVGGRQVGKRNSPRHLVALPQAETGGQFASAKEQVHPGRQFNFAALEAENSYNSKNNNYQWRPLAATSAAGHVAMQDLSEDYFDSIAGQPVGPGTGDNGLAAAATAFGYNQHQQQQPYQQHFQTHQLLPGRRYMNQHKNKRPVYAPINQQTVNGILSLLLLFVVSICGCIGTIFIISALTVIESLQTRGNCYLVSLALAHLLVTLVVIPSSALQIMAGDGINERLLCHYQWLTLEFSLIVSQLSFLLIAADNYLGCKSSEKVTASANLATALLEQQANNSFTLQPAVARQQQQAGAPNEALDSIKPEMVSRGQFASSQQREEQQRPLTSKQSPLAHSRPTKAISDSGGLAARLRGLIRRPKQTYGGNGNGLSQAAIGQLLASGSLMAANNGKRHRLRLAQQFSGLSGAQLEQPGCISYRGCCGRLKVLFWIVLVWSVALAYTLHQHDTSYGPKFCTGPAPKSSVQQLHPHPGLHQQQQQHLQQFHLPPDQSNASLAPRARWPQRQTSAGGNQAPPLPSPLALSELPHGDNDNEPASEEESQLAEGPAGQTAALALAALEARKRSALGSVGRKIRDETSSQLLDHAGHESYSLAGARYERSSSGGGGGGGSFGASRGVAAEWQVAGAFGRSPGPLDWPTTKPNSMDASTENKPKALKEEEEEDEETTTTTTTKSRRRQKPLDRQVASKGGQVEASVLSGHQMESSLTKTPAARPERQAAGGRRGSDFSEPADERNVRGLLALDLRATRYLSPERRQRARTAPGGRQRGAMAARGGSGERVNGSVAAQPTIGIIRRVARTPLAAAATADAAAGSQRQREVAGEEMEEAPAGGGSQAPGPAANWQVGGARQPDGNETIAGSLAGLKGRGTNSGTRPDSCHRNKPKPCRLMGELAMLAYRRSRLRALANLPGELGRPDCVRNKDNCTDGGDNKPTQRGDTSIRLKSVTSVPPPLLLAEGSLSQMGSALGAASSSKASQPERDDEAFRWRTGEQEEGEGAGGEGRGGGGTSNQIGHLPRLAASKVSVDNGGQVSEARASLEGAQAARLKRRPLACCWQPPSQPQPPPSLEPSGALAPGRGLVATPVEPASGDGPNNIRGKLSAPSDAGGLRPPEEEPASGAWRLSSYGRGAPARGQMGDEVEEVDDYDGLMNNDYAAGMQIVAVDGRQLGSSSSLPSVSAAAALGRRRRRSSDGLGLLAPGSASASAAAGPNLVPNLSRHACGHQLGQCGGSPERAANAAAAVRPNEAAPLLATGGIGKAKFRRQRRQIQPWPPSGGASNKVSPTANNSPDANENKPPPSSAGQGGQTRAAPQASEHLGGSQTRLVNNSTRPNSGSSEQVAKPKAGERANSSEPKFYWLMLVGTIVLPSLASTILFARAYLMMKEFKMRPYKPMPLGSLSPTLGSLLSQPPAVIGSSLSGYAGAPQPQRQQQAEEIFSPTNCRRPSAAHTPDLTSGSGAAATAAELADQSAPGGQVESGSSEQRLIERRQKQVKQSHRTLKADSLAYLATGNAAPSHHYDGRQEAEAELEWRPNNRSSYPSDSCSSSRRPVSQPSGCKGEPRLAEQQQRQAAPGPEAFGRVMDSGDELEAARQQQQPLADLASVHGRQPSPGRHHQQLNQVRSAPIGYELYHYQEQQQQQHYQQHHYHHYDHNQNHHLQHLNQRHQEQQQHRYELALSSPRAHSGQGTAPGYPQHLPSNLSPIALGALGCSALASPRLEQPRSRASIRSDTSFSAPPTATFRQECYPSEQMFSLSCTGGLAGDEQQQQRQRGAACPGDEKTGEGNKNNNSPAAANNNNNNNLEQGCSQAYHGDELLFMGNDGQGIAERQQRPQTLAEQQRQQVQQQQQQAQQRPNGQHHYEFRRHQHHAQSFHYGTTSYQQQRAAHYVSPTGELLSANGETSMTAFPVNHFTRPLGFYGSNLQQHADAAANHHLSPVLVGGGGGQFDEAAAEQRQQHLLERHRSLPRSSRLYQTESGLPRLVQASQTQPQSRPPSATPPHCQSAGGAAEEHLAGGGGGAYDGQTAGECKQRQSTSTSHRRHHQHNQHYSTQVQSQYLDGSVHANSGHHGGAELGIKSDANANSMGSISTSNAGANEQALSVSAALANIIKSMEVEETQAGAISLSSEATAGGQQAAESPSDAHHQGDYNIQKAPEANGQRPQVNKAILCTYSYMTDDQLLKSNIIVFVVNLTLWLPLILLSLASHYRDHLTQELKDGVWWMATLNCCSCSYVYALTNKDFREAFNKLFYYCCCKSHVTFQRKTPILRRQLDMDSEGNLRIHIIPALNVYSNKLSMAGAGGGGEMGVSHVHQTSAHTPGYDSGPMHHRTHHASSAAHPSSALHHHSGFTGTSSAGHSTTGHQPGTTSLGAGFGCPLFVSTSKSFGLSAGHQTDIGHRHHQRQFNSTASEL